MPTYEEDQLTFAGTHPSAMTRVLKQFVPFASLLPTSCSDQARPSTQAASRP
jgi:hypothetical protein